MMHYESDHHVQGNSNKSPLEQHLYSSTYMLGKVDQGQVNSMADNWQAGCHCSQPKPKPKRLSPPSVRFHHEPSVFQYEADEDEENDYYSFFSPSRSEEVSFKTTTSRGLMARRQELVEVGEDASSIGIQRRDGRIQGGFDISAHLISSVSIRKNLVSKSYLFLLHVAVTCLKIGLMTNVYEYVLVAIIVGTDISKEASHSGSTR